MTDQTTNPFKNGSTVAFWSGVPPNYIGNHNCVITDTTTGNVYQKAGGVWNLVYTPTGGSGGGLSAFYVTPNGYSGSIPSGYQQVAQNSSNVASVNLASGSNIVQVAAGCTGTVNINANAQPFIVDLTGAGLSSVTVNRVNAS